MTIPNQSDSREPSDSTASLSMVNLPFGNHLKITNLTTQKSIQQQSSIYHASYQSSPPSTTMNNTTSTKYYNNDNDKVEGGLVTSSSNGSNNKTGSITITSTSSSPSFSSATAAKYAVKNNQSQSVEHVNSSKVDANPTSPNNGYRPLNVIDALAYLDQVKNRFSDQPNVYNEFLDIMKDFKSQSIDTPGVIDRVSNLFKGYPQLISGFNTFLPAGYRIECSTDPRDPNGIKVTTPNCSVDQSKDTHYRTHSYLQSSSSSANQKSSTSITTNNITINHHSNSVTATHPPSSLNNKNLYNSISPQIHSSPTPSHLASTSLTSSKSQLHSIDSERKSPVEFNHAINYVNRIKNRFSNKPEIYKRFLEVLQTYQKEQKSISEVYEYVRYLFNGADDLLEEFKQFLPEMAQQDEIASAQQQSTKRSISTMDPTSVNYNNGPVKRKKTYVTKKSKLYQQDIYSSAQLEDMEDVIMTSYENGNQRLAVSLEEVDLFDRIKKYIGNRPSYEEFLKVLNLYTQQILDIDTFIQQVKPFLGQNKDLFDAFKSLLGYTTDSQSVLSPSKLVPKPDLSQCPITESSPSYRAVPKNWQIQPCSGRDQLCWEVLNDQYVSHPMWASEESGFTATSKRNVHEEALHRCEEERYEYDLNIEANLNTIALLKPIALQIENMTDEEKERFKLQPGLGGSTTSIYERIIKKIYDERGNEVIEMLYERPAAAVPVLLKRLQLKDNEWKKAQKEWNKIWRDIDAKNYYRSLDYQGNTFKANDKKQLATKALVTEIEQLQKQEIVPQFTFDRQHKDIIKDTSRLIFSYIEKQNGFTKADRLKIQKFMQSFPLLFHELEDVLDDDSLIEESDGDNRSSGDDNKSPIKDISNNQENDRLEATEEESSSNSLHNNVTTMMTLDTEQTKNMTHFYCNSNFYCLFKLFQTVCDRLMKMKLICENMADSPDKLQRYNQVAIELDLVVNRFEDIDLSRGYYVALMDIIDRFFEGYYDQQTFEESIRYVFGIDAYIMFTIDKTIQSLIKQIQVVAMDKKSIELFKLFNNGLLDNGQTIPITQYYTRVKQVFDSDENIYKIEFDLENHSTSIQLVNEDKRADF